MASSTDHHPALHHHFDDLKQQKASVTLGMWVFLVTEIMFFGGLFLAYLVYRAAYSDAFAAASHHLDATLGALNTVVLIGSSFTMVLAVDAAEKGKRNAVTLFVILTMVLGAAFLGVKAYEYHHKWIEHLVPGPSFAFEGAALGSAQIFFVLYFAMTGLHALHMVIGFGVMMAILIWNKQGRFTKEYSAQVHLAGLYWHFVDIVWIFLFPLLYLIDRSGG